MSTRNTAVAASSEWYDGEYGRQPAGDTHAWYPGTNQTLCGLALSRSGLRRFAGVPWSDVPVLAESAAAGRPVRVCPKCLGATRDRRGRPHWRRR